MTASCASDINGGLSAGQRGRGGSPGGRILRTTVPRLEELTDGVAPRRLQVAPDDGWSVSGDLWD
jgi:hypothetical protein